MEIALITVVVGLLDEPCFFLEILNGPGPGTVVIFRSRAKNVDLPRLMLLKVIRNKEDRCRESRNGAVLLISVVAAALW